MTSASGSRCRRCRCSSGPVKSVRGRRERLELAPLRPEADDHRTGVEPVQCLEQELHALLRDQLAEVDDGRLAAGEELREACRVAVVRLALVAAVRRVAAALLDEGLQRRLARLRHEPVDVDARRHLVHPLDLADDVLQHLADVLRADVDRGRRRERLAPPGREILVAAHRVLELRPVGLDAEGQPGGRADGAAEQDVVREEKVGRRELTSARRRSPRRSAWRSSCVKSCSSRASSPS